MMELKEFSQRLSTLRLNKDVSARDMSLSIGQSASYINNIETGVSFPSMTVFFYICEYLGITPSDFFDLSQQNPSKVNAIVEDLNGLTDEQLDAIAALVKVLAKK